MYFVGARKAERPRLESVMMTEFGQIMAVVLQQFVIVDGLLSEVEEEGILQY